MRGILFVGAVAVLALLVAIDATLKGEWLRALAGWAALAFVIYMGFWGFPRLAARFNEQLARESSAMKRPDGSRSWPLIVASVLLALLCFGGVLYILAAPYDDLLAYSRQTASLLRGLDAIVGQLGARMALAALFVLAGGTAAYTAWVRFKV
jgi:hypothetical protein